MSLAENINLVQKRIETATKRANRNPNDIKLVAVSKTKPIEMIKDAYNAGLRNFGENYAQDLASKAEILKDLDIKWHFIGHLQSNKINSIKNCISMLETIDSIKLAENISKRIEKPIKCLMEVNLGNEESKSGINQSKVFDLISKLSEFPKIELQGLMTVPPYFEDLELVRPYFKKLRELLNEINKKEIYPKKLTELSMGMSHDFEIAIEEGATIIRVGTAIFGERNN